MCGRYTLAIPAVTISNRFNIDIDMEKYEPVYNAAPVQNLPVITNVHCNQLSFLKWGLIPFWAKDPRIGYKMINARAETILDKNSFKRPFARNRCLVISDGFYEWEKIGPKEKIPYRFCLKSRDVYAMAGIWSTWRDVEARPIHSFSVITTKANKVVKPIHDRMPVILNKDDEVLWLDDKTTTDRARAMLKSYNALEMEAYRVSTDVNKAIHDFPELLEPVE
jgi:putative SOS response-associated peptidase YedK